MNSHRVWAAYDKTCKFSIYDSMYVCMYVCMYLLITVQLKGRLLWFRALVVTSQRVSQHQFGHLTWADPENSERGGRGTLQPCRYYIF